MRSIVVGDEGTILHTRDGGATWSETRPTPDRALNDAAFAGESGVFVVGDNDMILRSLDSGGTWQQISEGGGPNYRGVSFVNATTGWVCGEAICLHTTDGGGSWVRQPTGTFSILGVAFVDENNGMMVASLGPNGSEIRKTSDGGATWVAVFTGDRSIRLNRIVSVSPSRWYAVGTGVFRTDDAGATWTRFDVSGAFELFGIAFVDQDDGFAVGINGIFQTTDGGQTWSPGYLQPDISLRAISACPSCGLNTAIAVGSSGRILSTADGGSTWKLKTNGLFEQLLGVKMFNATNAIVTGGGGLIARTRDLGSTWEILDSGTGADLWGVQFLDENTGVVVGGNGAILHTVDGGDSWSARPTGVSGDFHWVAFADANTGMAVADGGVIMRTDDGGLTWLPLASGSGSRLNGVTLLDSNRATAVGENGTILQTDDGGQTWVPRDSGTNQRLWSVAFADENRGTAVGYSAFLSTTDGGLTWVSRPGLGDLWHVTFINASVGYVVGTAIARTDDGGATWMSQTAPPINTRGSFLDTNVGMVVGGGIVLTTTNGGIEPPKLASLRDPFAGDSINPDLWHVDAAGGAATETGGDLVLRLNPGQDAFVIASSDPAYTLVDSQARVRLDEVVATGNVNTIFAVQLDWNNWLGWWYENGVLYALAYVGGTRIPVAALPYSPGEHRWLTISDNFGFVHWQTSNGTTVVDRGWLMDSAVFSLESVGVVFSAAEFAGGAPDPGQARFANLN